MATGETCGILLSDDMIFSSRIIGTAQAQRLKMQIANSVKNLLAQAKEQSPVCIIVDLSHSELQVHDLIQELRNIGSPAPHLVAYGSHVDVAGLRAAREAGCDVVLPRSQFVEQLASQLPQWLAPRNSSPAHQSRLE
jgi:CheY-like chemotaxis protein